jgi:hypothetical protein
MTRRLLPGFRLDGLTLVRDERKILAIQPASIGTELHFMTLITEKQRFWASLSGVFLTFWLTLFCQDCAAGAMPAGTSPIPSNNRAYQVSLHPGIPGHECHGNCTSVYIRTEAAVSKQLLTPFPPESPALRFASNHYLNAVPDNNITPQALTLPSRAILHPLVLNCVQLK